jgi:hypothetical protein
MKFITLSLLLLLLLLLVVVVVVVVVAAAAAAAAVAVVLSSSYERHVNVKLTYQQVRVIWQNFLLGIPCKPINFTLQTETYTSCYLLFWL